MGAEPNSIVSLQAQACHSYMYSIVLIYERYWGMLKMLTFLDSCSAARALSFPGSVIADRLYGLEIDIIYPTHYLSQNHSNRAAEMLLQRSFGRIRGKKQFPSFQNWNCWWIFYIFGLSGSGTTWLGLYCDLFLDLAPGLMTLAILEY